MSITGTTGMSQTSASWLDDSKNLKKNHEVNTRAKKQDKEGRKKRREEVCWHFKPSESKAFCQQASPPALITMKQQLLAKCLWTALLTQTGASNQI